MWGAPVWVLVVVWVGSTTAGYGVWTREDRVHPSIKREFTFLLQQRNQDKLDRAFWSVSDPQSPSYGEYLSHKEIADMVAPPEKHRNVVVEYLKGQGATHITVATTLDMVRCSMTLDLAERLFGTRFHWFRNSRDASKRFLRHEGFPGCTPSIPSPLMGIVTHVPEVCSHPLLHASVHVDKPVPTIPRPHQVGAYPFDPPFEPVQLKKLFNVPDTWVGNDSVRVGQAVMTEQSFCPADLQLFLQKWVPAAAGQTVQEVHNFTNNNTDCEREANVDVQYAIGMGPHVYTVFWGIDDWVDIAYGYFASLLPPKTWSVSYHQGYEYQVKDFEEYWRMNFEYQKMGASGGTLIFSSSDNGAGCDPTKNTFGPFVPQSSPYITTVGATQTQYTGRRLVHPSSGGGFSDHFTQPSYQTALVKDYLDRKYGASLPPAGVYNASGRGYPDLSGEGWDIYFYRNGAIRGTSGTSTTAPQIAGLVSLLNARRTSAGLPVLGFLNPLLYQLRAAHPTTFNDTAEGYSTFPYSTEGCTPVNNWGVGYFASQGWNPVTGLGQPDIQVIAGLMNTFPKRFQNLP